MHSLSNYFKIQKSAQIKMRCFYKLRCFKIIKIFTFGTFISCSFQYKFSKRYCMRKFVRCILVLKVRCQLPITLLETSCRVKLNHLPNELHVFYLFILTDLVHLQETPFHNLFIQWLLIIMEFYTYGYDKMKFSHINPNSFLTVHSNSFMTNRQ